MTTTEFDSLITMLKSSDDDDSSIAKENVKNLNLDLITNLLIAKSLALTTRYEFFTYLEEEMQMSLRTMSLHFRDLHTMIKKNSAKEEHKILFKHIVEDQVRRYYADLYNFCDKIDISIKW